MPTSSSIVMLSSHRCNKFKMCWMVMVSLLLTTMTVDGYIHSNSNAQNERKKLIEPSIKPAFLITPPLAAPATTMTNLRQAEAKHGMPWMSSISSLSNNNNDKKNKKNSSCLLYMPFWNWQMQFMESHFTNITILSCDNGHYDFQYNVNTKKQARVVNVCLSCNEYRKVRMTYYDGGEAVQVFNSVWYPHTTNDGPILGIDLLYIGGKYITIMDFQPLHNDQLPMIERTLQPIKDRYAVYQENNKQQQQYYHQTTMSSNFYNATQFFSPHILFAKGKDIPVMGDVYDAFCDQLQAYHDLITQTLTTSTSSSDATSSLLFVHERQVEYDIYSASRDPAIGLFSSMFGEEWAHEFVHDFLFSHSGEKNTRRKVWGK